MRIIISLLCIVMASVCVAHAGSPAIKWPAANVRINTNPAGGTVSTNPAVAADGNLVAVVWQDKRAGNEDVYCNVSSDGGKTWWANDVRLNTNSAGHSRSLFPSVAVSGSRILVAWQDNRSGYADIYYNYSADGGATWLGADVRMNVGSNAGEKLAWPPDVFLSGNYAYVVWLETRVGYVESLFINYSTNMGTTWQGSDVQIDDGTADVLDYKVRVIGQNVYVVWQNSSEDISFQRSLSNGEQWLADDVVLNTSDTGSRSNPDFDVEDNKIVVFWDRYYNFSNYSHMNYSANNGNTWQGTESTLGFRGAIKTALRDGVVHVVYSSDTEKFYRRYANSTWSDATVVRTAAGASDGTPDFLANEEMLFVAWEDEVCLDQSLRYNFSPDGGAHFLEAPEIYDNYINDNACGGSGARAGEQAVAISGDMAYVAWQDYRNGMADVYFTRAELGGGTLPPYMLLLTLNRTDPYEALRALLPAWDDDPGHVFAQGR